MVHRECPHCGAGCWSADTSGTWTCWHCGQPVPPAAPKMYSMPGVTYRGEKPLDDYPEYTCLYPNKRLDRRCEEDCPPKVRDRAKCPRNGWDVRKRRAAK